MKRITTTTLFLVCLTLFVSAQNNKITIGERISIQSQILSEERELLIYLPNGYEESKKEYPVIYLLDGDWHFSHTVGILKFLTSPVVDIVPEMIVVAIKNIDRNRDYTFPSSAETTKEFTTRGGSDKFTAFIKEELKPFINEKYRTEAFSILIGHSLGGLYVVNTLLNDPELFDAYIAIDPSLWWDNQSLIDKAEKIVDNNLKSILYITFCEDAPHITFSTSQFVEVLNNKKPQNLSWGYKFMPNEFHSSMPHRSTYDGLEFIFKDWRFSAKSLKYFSIPNLKDHYTKLTAKFGFECKPSESFLNIWGYSFLRAKDIESAIELFSYCVELYPESANAYDSLGEGHMTNGDTELAIKYYNKSLELNPGNDNAHKMLAKLKHDN